MSKKKELAREYRLKAKLNTERYLEGGSNIEKAYIAGWDAAAKEIINQLRQTLSLMSNVHPSIQKHIIDVVESNIIDE